MKIGRAKALWKVPELWKNQKAVFPQLLGPSVQTSHNAGCYWTFLKHNFPSTPQDRIVTLARERGGIQGRRMRVDTTVVETNIHYPTDSGLLSDGARALTRTMKKIAGKAGGLKRKVRDRTRSVRKRVIAIAQAVRHKGMEGERKRQREYRQLLRLTRQILNDSQRVLEEVERLPARRRRAVQGLRERLETMADQVRRVVRQTQARVLQGITQFPDKLLSLFETHTEIVRKGKVAKPNEFGNVVELQEAENQIITH